SAHKYNTPVLRDGLLYGMAGGGKTSTAYCMDASNGNLLWSDKTPRGECPNILSVGSVLVILSSDGNLVVFEPSNKEYKEVAKYRVSDKMDLDGPWTVPILTGNRIYVKDVNNALTLAPLA